MSNTKSPAVVVRVAESDDIQAEMTRLLQQFMGMKKPFHGFNERTWRPPTDIYETDCTFIVLMEIAGVDKSAINIEYRENYMYVTGVRKIYQERAGVSYIQMEIKHGTFAMELRLPKDLDTSETNARYVDGFLTITIPKRSPQPARTINIEGEG